MHIAQVTVLSAEKALKFHAAVEHRTSGICRPLFQVIKIKYTSSQC